MLKTPDIEKLETNVKEMLKILNLPVETDPHLKDTPKRIAKMYVNDLLKGLYTEPPYITQFEDADSAEAVVSVDNIEVKSICSHHFVPFYGKAFITYAPRNNRIVGLSKFARIVDYFARTPQVQERLTKQITEFIFDQVNPWYVITGLVCRHLCLACRGANDNSATMNTVYFKAHESMNITQQIDVMYNKLSKVKM